MTLNPAVMEDLVMRMQGAFLDTPTLRLTLREAQRRFDVDPVTCEAILATLVDAHVLARTPRGDYARFFPRPAATAA